MVYVSPPTVHKQCIRRRNGTDDYSTETPSPYRSFFRRPFGAPIPNLLTLNLERSAVSGSPDPAQACKSSAGGNGAPSRVPARPGTITLPAVTHYQAGSHWTMPPWQASWPHSGYISLRPFCGWKTFGHITLPGPTCVSGLPVLACITIMYLSGTAAPGTQAHKSHFQERPCTPGTANVKHALVWPVWDHPRADSNGQSHKMIMLQLQFFSRQTTTPVVVIPHWLYDLFSMEELGRETCFTFRWLHTPVMKHRSVHPPPL